MTAVARVHPDPPVDATTTGADLREFPGGEFWHRGTTTGGAWVRVPLDALATVAGYVAVTS